MKDAKDVIPWKVTDISIRPYDEMWSFNPSVHFDGSTWRCVVRCCDYAMPDGRTIRSKGARPTGQQTKNAMIIFDPVTWKPIRIYKMQEKDDLPRASTPHVGYEDMRIFRTDAGGLQGIAASLHLKREARINDGRAQNQPPEQVLLSFDSEYNVVGARPIRGGEWSGTPQKNWVPFDHSTEPRFLFSIGKGTLFGDRGPVSGDATKVKPSAVSRPTGTTTPAPVVLPVSASPSPVEVTSADPRERKDARPAARDVQHARGRRMALDASTSRPSALPSYARSKTMPVRSDQTARVMNTGRARLPGYEGLRGGTQLVHIGNGGWLGIGHEMRFVNSKKFYWHTWYVVDSTGKMTMVSEPMKLVSNGIEFAAGMAIDGDRVVVSFGVDDMECKIGETRLSAVMEQIRPIAR